MNKLSINHHGIQVETHEKTNVMTPYNSILCVICIVSSLFVLCDNPVFVKISGIILLFLYSLIWLIVYITHSIKSSHKLQSETYRLEIQRIEAGMIENPKEQGIIESPSSNIELIENKGREKDIND